ncbi:MAG: HEAT repeat domain-containing protein [Candidatus Krumholzibacteria bacterium]|nr:HEAT repeat domain-containing protein [Candidatus Krumholzibacteria bacterium]
MKAAALTFLLSAVFTVGLTFATVELPRLADRALQDRVPVPGFDSHADATARLKTELFISHYRLRTVGYACFAALVLLVAAGFAGRRAGLAAAGGLAFMLPVFAQFAGVMFFLAGLGLLNVVWLPVLDLSFDISRLGLAIRAPFDGLRRLFGLFNAEGYWPIVIFFVAAGLLIFFLGTFAWLRARSRGRPVAGGLIYRLSRHPQYLGWILWSYGIYLLIEQGRYPRRSWMISASLPWLLGTMTIVGVAMLEELAMKRRHGESYEAYRRSAPFLLPLPSVVSKVFSIPSRVLFGHGRPGRRGEVAAVVAIYTAIVMAASVLFYDGGLSEIAALARPAGRRAAAAELAAAVRQEPGTRRGRALADRLARIGDPALEPMLGLLACDDPEARVLAAERLHLLDPDHAVPALCAALGDQASDVRYHALRGLARIPEADCAGEAERLLGDPEGHIRIEAMRFLAARRSPAAAGPAVLLLESEHRWERSAGADILGALGSPDAVPALSALLCDTEPEVRRSAVIALLRIGSPDVRGPLRGAARDPDREVRIYAAEALRRLRGGS